MFFIISIWSTYITFRIMLSSLLSLEVIIKKLEIFCIWFGFLLFGLSRENKTLKPFIKRKTLFTTFLTILRFYLTGGWRQITSILLLTIICGCLIPLFELLSWTNTKGFSTEATVRQALGVFRQKDGNW